MVFSKPALYHAIKKRDGHFYYAFAKSTRFYEWLDYNYYRIIAFMGDHELADRIGRCLRRETKSPGSHSETDPLWVGLFLIFGFPNIKAIVDVVAYNVLIVFLSKAV